MAKAPIPKDAEYSSGDALGMRMGNLRIRHLQLLDQIDKRGSLSAAAASIGVSQPRSTVMLRELEHAAGRLLLDRSPKGGTLNAAGRVAISRLRVALGSLETFQQSMHDVEPRPLLRIGVPPVLGSDTLCNAIAGLQEEGRLPQISMRTGNIGMLMALLLEGDVDCVLSSLDSGGPSQHLEQRLHITPLWEERFHVVAARAHPIVRKRRVTLKESLLQPWVMMPTASANRQALERMFLTAGYPPPQPAVETESPHIALALVRRSRMLSLVAESAYRQSEGMLGLVRLEKQFHPARINLITLVDTPRLPVVDAFAGGLQQAALRV